MKTKTILIITLVFITAFIALFAILFLSIPILDENSKTGIIGALAGSLGGAIVSLLTSIVTIWKGDQETFEKKKERISNHALELTRMDYELRQKSLESTMNKEIFLAPIKVYRELYKALLEFDETGNWPKTINELGLLRIFEFAPIDHPRAEDTDNE